MVVKSWFLIGGVNVKTPLNFRDVREEFIWGNNFITLNKKTIFNSNLSNAGVRYVNDLLDHQNILSEKFLRSKMGRKSDWMSQTYILINALPDPWKKMLRNYPSTQTFVNTTNSSLWRLDDFKNKKIEKHDESVKTLYTFLMRN